MKNLIIGTSLAASAIMLFAVPSVQAAPGDFYSVAPCRILDTRDGTGDYAGPIAHNTAIHISINTDPNGSEPVTDFTAQGGVATDCGLPVETTDGTDAPTVRPTAVAITVTAVTPSQKGHVRVAPEGAGTCTQAACDDPATLVPNTSTVNYIRGEDLANSTVVQILDDTTAYELLLSNHQWGAGDDVDLLVDVLGWYE